MDQDEEPSIQVLHDSNRRRGRSGINGNVFRTFVSVSLLFLILLHVYAYFFDHPFSESIDGDFSDVKYAVMQLSRGLTEVNRKHERLQQDLERISSSLPSVVAAANRARDTISAAAAVVAATKGRLTGVDAHDFDRQVIDFALESAGGRVIDVGDTVHHTLSEGSINWAFNRFASVMCRECLGAPAVIRPGTLPGECWAFQGSRGEVTVLLLGPVLISGVSLEHIPLHISPTGEISSAPRSFQVLGLQKKYDPNSHDFGVFEYDKEGKSIQYFEVKNSSPKAYPMAKFKFLSNWGNPTYTCVYRVRVHGELDKKTDSAGDAHVQIA